MNPPIYTFNFKTLGASGTREECVQKKKIVSDNWTYFDLEHTGWSIIGCTVYIHIMIHVMYAHCARVHRVICGKEIQSWSCALL